jgi:hypothetical protein
VDAPVTLIRPPRFPAALVRPRLEHLLDTPSPGLLLVGPAGYGKTVLAARWAAGRVGAWVRVVPERAGARDLVELAAASLAAEGPPAGAGILELAAHLLDLVAPGTLLVVDDYQQALGDECDPLLAEVLALLPAGSKVVVCSRGRPPGLIGRAAEGLVRVVDGAELAFTGEEAVALFRHVGAAEGDGAVAFRELGGWPAGLALAATSGFPAHAEEVARSVAAAVPEVSGPAGEVVMALSVLPYLTAPLAAELGLDPAVLPDLAERSVLVSEHAGQYALAEAAVHVIAPQVDAGRRRRWRAAAATQLEAVDVAASIELLLDDAEPEAAAELLHRHLSEVSPARCLPWLYRFPPEVRHRFPPAVAAGRATVDLDAATAAADERVLTATSDDARREALYALGSAHLHAGRLSAAAGALESACSAGGPATVATSASAWLAVVRWWAGDVEGALAAAGAAGDDVVGVWAEAEARVATGDLDAAVAAAVRGARLASLPDATLSPAAFEAIAAKVALLRDRHADRAPAGAAYQHAVATGGFELAVAGPVYAWYLVNAADDEAALAVVDTVNRRMARHDLYSSLHVQCVRLAVATRGGDRAAQDEARRRISAIRQLGFALVESQAVAALLPLSAQAGPALRVQLLGPVRVTVDGQVVPSSSWRSLKAVEVLAYLALRGDRGAHREEAIEAVWPDREPDKGRMLLRAALSEIRRRLEPARPAGEPSLFLQGEGDRVVLRADVDAREVRALARQGQPAAAFTTFGGELLEDFPYAEWAIDERQAMDALHADLAERALGDVDVPVDVRIGAAEWLVAQQPWRDDVVARLSTLRAGTLHDGG